MSMTSNLISIRWIFKANFVLLQIMKVLQLENVIDIFKYGVRQNKYKYVRFKINKGRDQGVSIWGEGGARGYGFYQY